MPARPQLACTLTGLALLVCCGDDSGPEQSQSGSTGEASSDTSSAADSNAADSDGGDTGPSDCVAGQDGCACLDGACSGTLHCIEQICVPGPKIEVPEDRELLAGLRIPLSAEVVADAFTWTQIEGPSVEILQPESTNPLIDIPPDVAAGSVITLRLEAERNTIVDARDVSLTIVPAVFENWAPEATTEQLATTEGLDMEGNNMWVVSTEGFVARFDPEATFVSRFDIAGQPVGARVAELDDVDRLLVANAGLSQIQVLDLGDGSATTLIDSAQGEGLGPVNFVLPGPDGRIFFSNRAGGRVFVYDGETQTTTIFIEGLGSNPNALSFGPEANVLYVGTWGQVHRVPIERSDDVTIAGTPTLYLEFGATDDIAFEVDGLTFDEGGNLWVGSPNNRTLYVAPYVDDGATAVAWQASPADDTVNRFVNLRFGRGGFDRESLYYTNLQGTIGRLYVGLSD